MTVLYLLQFVRQNHSLYDTKCGGAFPVGVLELLSLANTKMDTNRAYKSRRVSLGSCLGADFSYSSVLP